MARIVGPFIYLGMGMTAKYALFFMLVGSQALGMANAAVQARVDAFNKWKENPGKTDPIFLLEVGSDGTDAHSVAMYTNLTVLTGNIPDSSMADKVNEAVQFAQQVCPSFELWPEFFQLMREKKDGKGYSVQKDIKLVLKPLIKKINQYRVVVSILSHGDKLPQRELLDIEQELRKLKAALKPGQPLNLLTIVSTLVPARKAELHSLQKEFEKLSNPDILCQVVYAAVEVVDKKQEKNAVLKHDLKQLSVQNEKFLKSHERMKALMALHESSQTTNWQADLVHVIQNELDKTE